MTGRVQLRVGTSGWQYDSWRGPFYPPALRQQDWLEWYASRFAVVEVNNTFYQLPSREAVSRWHARTPEGFRFALKFSRFLTHIRRLRDADDAVGRFFERVEPLESKLGPVLLQLPPTFEAAPPLLAAALDAFPRGVRVSVEVRHRSWFTDEVRRLLEARDVAFCLADRRSRLQTPLWRTASWGYVRLHEGRASPIPCYGREALASWADRIETLFTDGEVFVFFNNDARACAVRNAATIERLVTRRAARGRSAAATELQPESV